MSGGSRPLLLEMRGRYKGQRNFMYNTMNHESNTKLEQRKGENNMTSSLGLSL